MKKQVGSRGAAPFDVAAGARYHPAWIVRSGVLAPELGKPCLYYLVGSAAMVDSVKLRMIARRVKLDVIEKSGQKEYADWYRTLVRLPVGIMFFCDGGRRPRPLARTR